MKQQKRTPKKKSGQSSLSPKSELRVFDTSNAKIIGRVEKKTPTNYILSWAGVLNFQAAPVDGGAAFKVVASIHNPLIPKTYELERSAVRGSYLNDSVALEVLYEEYVKRCNAGEYHLNPLAKRVAAELSQGDGAAEAPSSEVNTVPATPEKQETPPAADDPATSPPPPPADQPSEVQQDVT